MKDINTTLDKYLEEVQKVTNELYPGGKVTNVFVKNKSKAKEHNFIFELPNNSRVRLFVWYSPDGISYSETQGNKRAEQKILKSILSQVDEKFQTPMTTNNYTFNADEKLFIEIKDEFVNDQYKLEETAQNNIIKIVLDEVYNVTITWFDSKKILMQGKNSPLWADLFFWMSEKLELNSKDMVSKYIESNVELNSIEIKIDDNFVLGSLSDILGEDIINNRQLLISPEVELLKTSNQFLSLNITSPDYSLILTPAFRVMEGILRRIIIKHNLTDDTQGENPQKDRFYQFHTHGNKLQEQFRKMLNDDINIIEILESIYNIYCTYRLVYCHSDGVNPVIIDEKQKAIAIFDDICTLLKKMHKYTDKLFNVIDAKV